MRRARRLGAGEPAGAAIPEGERKPFPSKASLSERSGLSPRRIQRHIAELKGVGLVRRTQR